MISITASCRLLMTAFLAISLGAPSLAAGSAPSKRVLIVSGPSQHPPGTHESAAGARVLRSLLGQVEAIGPDGVTIVEEWPVDRSVLDRADVLVFVGDVFPGETLNRPEAVKAEIARQVARGCGVVCLHYATGLRAAHVPESGEHPLLQWIGGYFASNCAHHKSVARVVTATLTPEPIDHPVLRGWKAFTCEDEPYWNNYFGPGGMAPNVRSLVTAMLPPEDPKKQTICWAIERADGGRGLGLVMPHFYRNWRDDDLRTLIVNAVAWAARLDVPAEGLKTPRPDLARFDPAAVEPQPPQTKAAKKKTAR